VSRRSIDASAPATVDRDTGVAAPAGWKTLLSMAIPLALLVAPLPFLGNLREQLAPFLILTTAATILLYGFHYLLERRDVVLAHGAILGVALALRLMLLPMSPSLSDDAWRYIWDGRLLLNGINPYHHIPASPAIAHYADRLLELQGYPTTHTIYPPGAQLIFASAVAIGEASGTGYIGGYFVWKIILVAGEMIAIHLLLLMLERNRMPGRRAILYAWHPLVLVELAGQGHSDGLWVLSLAIFLYMLSARSAVGAALGIAFGAVTRLFTLLLVPLWWRISSARERIAGGIALAVGLLLFLPLTEPRAFETFTSVGVRFTNYYEFNGGFYRAIKWMFDELHLAPSNAMAGLVGVAMQGVLLLLVLARRGWRSADPETIARGVMAIVTAQLFFGTKVHVWYFVAPLFLLVVARGGILRTAWLWVALAGPFTYLYYGWEPNAERIGVIALEWGGFICIVAAELFLERRRPA
jgi:hypothetical protein